MSSELRGLRQQHKGLTLRKLISTKKLIYTAVFSRMHLIYLRCEKCLPVSTVNAFEKQNLFP